MMTFFSHCPVCTGQISDPTEYCRRCGCNLLLLQKVKAMQKVDLEWINLGRIKENQTSRDVIEKSSIFSNGVES